MTACCIFMHETNTHMFVQRCKYRLNKSYKQTTKYINTLLVSCLQTIYLPSKHKCLYGTRTIHIKRKTNLKMTAKFI